mgnify:FL=1
MFSGFFITLFYIYLKFQHRTNSCSIYAPPEILFRDNVQNTNSIKVSIPYLVA